MKYSLTHGGILVSVIGSLLVSQGFSEQCSGELMTVVPVLVGGVMSWIGRYRAGGTTILGTKE